MLENERVADPNEGVSGCRSEPSVLSGAFNIYCPSEKNPKLLFKTSFYVQFNVLISFNVRHLTSLTSMFFLAHEKLTFWRYDFPMTARKQSL